MTLFCTSYVIFYRYILASYYDREYPKWMATQTQPETVVEAVVTPPEEPVREVAPPKKKATVKKPAARKKK